MIVNEPGIAYVQVSMSIARIGYYTSSVDATTGCECYEGLHLPHKHIL